MKKTLFAFFLLFLLLPACIPSGEPKQETANVQYPFQDPSLPIKERAKDLVSRLTLEEKVQQMMYNAPAIEKLGIPAYPWWSECLHGVARAGKATVFPQAIGMAASFDPDLISRIASAIGDEGRAFFHAADKRGNRLQYGGLTYWTPNINIFRDPRWGRGQETYGEDPWLTGTLGSAFVKGLQGDNPKYLKAAACAKHFAVHSGPEALRHGFNAVVSMQDMNETYLPAFKKLVEAGVEGVMCAYNRTNDEPCCGNTFLLQEKLRKEWKFNGYITSDCWALVDFYEGHKVVKNAVEAATLALKRGVNLNCGSVYYPSLIEAVKQGLVKEQEVDSALVQLLLTRFRLGLFDPPSRVPYAKIPESAIHSPEHKALAREAARKSIVLLKNKNHVLPLKKDTRYIYVVGPNATNAEVLLGNYYGVSDNLNTILAGIAAKVPPGCFIQYKQGCLLDRENINPIDWTTGEAKQADATIAVMGLSGNLEGEEGESIASATKGDRLDIGLPANQINFLKKLREGNTKPIIVIVTGGGPIAMPEVEELADAILFVWYPGEEGGNAVGDILYGDAVPSGRLPVTFPRSLDQLPPFEDYSMTGRTYRFMEKEPLYPFGFGLSYTSFSFSDLRLSTDQLQKGKTLQVKVSVSNTGKLEAEEVVQLYVKPPRAAFRVPLASLRGVKRVLLAPGRTQDVEFTLAPEDLSVVDDKGNLVQIGGEYEIVVGESSPSSRSEALGAAKPVSGKVMIM